MTPQVIGLFMFAMLSGTLMSVSMKYLSQYNALFVNAVAMTVAALVLFIIYLSQKQSWEAWFSFHRGMVVLWIALAWLNYGYSAIYGQGIALSYVPLIVTGGMTVLLALAGWLWFQEPITWKFALWSRVILAGMGIIMMK